MRIGELARRAGVAASTIRFYESSGLLPAVTRGMNGYREYSEESLRKLLTIQVAQRLGFSLDAVRSVLVTEGGFPHEAVLEKLTARLVEIDTIQTALAAQRQEVERMLATMRAHWAAGQCVQLDALSAQLQTAPRVEKRHARK